MSAADQASVRVLVVDDSQVFRHVLSVVVAAAPGFDVVGEACSGREALHLIDVLDVQFVLLDLQMPDWDGIETAIRIRRRHPDVAVLLLTAMGHAAVSDSTLRVEDKRDLSPESLAEFWQRHGAKNGA